VIPEPGRPLTVLVVDDENLVRTATRRLLRLQGHTVILAADGRECLQRLSEQHNKIDVVLLDLIMPVMDGCECFEQLQALYPDLPVIFCSGYTKGSIPIPEVAQDNIDEANERYAFLHKPWAPDELEATLALVTVSLTREAPSSPS
jgi:CheY-like chemotaxis protein